MIIQEIPYASLLYESTKQFREEILRIPLGLTLSTTDVAGEEAQIHIAAIEDESTIVGTVLLKPLSSTLVKLRQMAVSPIIQSQGLGRKLMQFAEDSARTRRFETIEMHARVYAQGFYSKLGYKAVGEAFIEVTVPTIKMVKQL